MHHMLAVEVVVQVALLVLFAVQPGVPVLEQLGLQHLIQRMQQQQQRQEWQRLGSRARETTVACWGCWAARHHPAAVGL